MTPDEPRTAHPFFDPLRGKLAAIPPAAFIAYFQAIRTAGVFDGCKFTADWTTRRIFAWYYFLGGGAGDIRDYLDIGSFEGRSALLAAWLFPNAHITCIDTFDADWPPGRVPSLDATFDANTARLRPRLTKLTGYSASVLSGLMLTGAAFDVIFVDGSHTHDDVMLDTLMAWRCLRKGGYLIWDDYPFHHPAIGTPTPRQAIDHFIDTHAAAMEPIFAGWQVCVRRTG